ncbi:hypothetical protein C8F04DRAFT_1180637 [Mycena alexandri]|uniref:Uncharacterized protein n=1 Tax=Mycena alexandri TaxID=1745969 RepID=A0AAD6T1U1_9AGAR|nr:hypothetical protein C8F04DRAFT_1180637 [Mycena alexandri]
MPTVLYREAGVEVWFVPPRKREAGFQLWTVAKGYSGSKFRFKFDRIWIQISAINWLVMKMPQSLIEDMPGRAGGGGTWAGQCQEGNELALRALESDRDLLADVPVVGANEMCSLADWPGEVSVGFSRQGRAAGKKTWDREAEKIAF